MRANVRIDPPLLAPGREQVVHVLLELTASAARDARPPLDVALVLDRSAPGLQLAKAFASTLFRRLPGTDAVALVACGARAELLAPLRPLEEARGLLAAVVRMRPAGPVDVAEGWRLATHLLRSARRGRARRTVLAGGGPTAADPEELIREVRRAADDEGIGTAVVGLGPDLDRALLARLAEAGGGEAHVATAPRELDRVIAGTFFAPGAPVARGVSAEIRPAPGVELLSLHPEGRTAAPGALRAELGDCHGHERRRVLARLLVAPPRPGPMLLAEVVVRYLRLGGPPVGGELRLPVVRLAAAAEDAAPAEADAVIAEEILALGATGSAGG